MRGAVAGLAVGDALGAPVEGLSPAAVAARHPGGIHTYVPAPGVRPGQVTDDTEMAFLVARSLVERRGLDMGDVSRRLIAWEDGGGLAGPSTSQGVDALRRGEPWSHAGSSAHPSSGCLPRCVPIALALPLGRVAADTLDCCRPTHRHELSLASSVTLNGIVARLVAGTSWNEALRALDAGDPPIAGADRVRAAIWGESEGPDGAVVVLAQAIAAVDGADSAAEAIAASVSAGGDADTAGSVAGALAGARWGPAGLPEEWVKTCEAAAEAGQLADGLVALRDALAGT